SAKCGCAPMNIADRNNSRKHDALPEDEGTLKLCPAARRDAMAITKAELRWLVDRLHFRRREANRSIGKAFDADEATGPSQRSGEVLKQIEEFRAADQAGKHHRHDDG